MATVEERLQRLEDLEAIRDLQVGYGEACDAGYDVDAIAPLFTDDCVWDGGEVLGRAEGIGALREFFSGAGQRFTLAVHFMIAPRTEIAADGNSATGSWYLLEPCTIAEDGQTTAFWVAAVYDAVYRREGVWKFHQLIVDTRIMAPHATGWAP